MRADALVLMSVIFLAGCSVPMNKVLSTSERTVAIQSINSDYAAAQALANQECAKVGRLARLSMKKDLQFIYDCVN